MIDTSGGYRCRHCRDGEVIAELNEHIRRLNEQLAQTVKANELIIDTLRELYAELQTTTERRLKCIS